MNVTISVDFGQGYRVALSPTDARHLYDQLKPMFEVPTVSWSTCPNTFQVDPSIPKFATGMTTGTLWSTLDMVTEKELPVDKMAAELEAKVKAEMDKQGLTDAE